MSTQDDRGPLVIAKQGYFFAGGHYEDGEKGKRFVGQIYVEYQIPQDARSRWPIVMIHGGSQTGTNFTGTPDGREGWAQFFVRRGWPVYVVDTVGRGRAQGTAAAYGEARPPDLATARDRFVNPAGAKLWPQAMLHTQFPGKGQAGDDVFDQFIASQATSIADYSRQQALNAAAGAALLDRIGPSVLLTHSQSGTFGWLIADRRPGLVKAIAAIEPNGPPVHDITFKGAPTWFSESDVFKEGGLCHLPLTWDPPLAAGERLSVERETEASGEGLVACWRQREPARKLANLAGVPVMVVQGEASYHAPFDHCTAQFLRQAGVETTFVRLADQGIRGNGHMMMIEKNSDEIAGLVAGWLDEQLG